MFSIDTGILWVILYAGISGRSLYCGGKLYSGALRLALRSRRKHETGTADPLVPSTFSKILINPAAGQHLSIFTHDGRPVL